MLYQKQNKQNIQTNITKQLKKIFIFNSCEVIDKKDSYLFKLLNKSKLKLLRNFLYISTNI